MSREVLVIYSKLCSLFTRRFAHLPEVVKSLGSTACDVATQAYVVCGGLFKFACGGKRPRGHVRAGLSYQILALPDVKLVHSSLMHKSGRYA